MSKIILIIISNHILLKVEIDESKDLKVEIDESKDLKVEIDDSKEWCSSTMFTAALFTIAKTWKQPKCPSTDEWIKKTWYNTHRSIIQ